MWLKLIIEIDEILSGKNINESDLNHLKVLLNLNLSVLTTTLTTDPFPTPNLA